MIVPVSMVRYVKVHKPLLIKNAENCVTHGKLTKALQYYSEAAEKYRFLGWYAHALKESGKILVKQGKNKEAEAILKPLINQNKKLSLEVAADYQQALRLYCQILLADKRYQEVLPLLRRLQSGCDRETAAWAFYHSGEAFMAEQQYRAAAREYIQLVTLFDHKKHYRQSALRRLVKCTAEFDKKLSIFYLKRLKKEYNDSILQSCR